MRTARYSLNWINSKSETNKVSDRQTKRTQSGRFLWSMGLYSVFTLNAIFNGNFILFTIKTIQSYELSAARHYGMEKIFCRKSLASRWVWVWLFIRDRNGLRSRQFGARARSLHNLRFMSIAQCRMSINGMKYQFTSRILLKYEWKCVRARGSMT